MDVGVTDDAFLVAENEDMVVDVCVVLDDTSWV